MLAALSLSSALSARSRQVASCSFVVRVGGKVAALFARLGDRGSGLVDASDGGLAVAAARR